MCEACPMSKFINVAIALFLLWGWPGLQTSEYMADRRPANSPADFVLAAAWQIVCR